MRRLDIATRRNDDYHPPLHTPAFVSIKVMTWAFEQRIPANVKIVLLSLADNANDDGYCWPSQDVIAYKSSVSVRNLRRLLSQLEERGLITIDRRHDRSGHRASNGYYVGPFRDEPQVEPLPDNMAGGPTGQMDTSYRPTVAGQEPSVEPPKKVSARQAELDFDRFWDAYPRKVSKGDARSAWGNALKLAPADVIIAGLERLRPSLVDNEDPKFIPYPASWLNKRRWLDDTPPPRKPTGKPAERPQINAQNAWEYR